MSGEIICFGATGESNYYQIRSLINAEIANGAALEVYNISHWASYVVTCAEQAGSGAYVSAIPGYLPAGLYKATLYTVLGGFPAAGDSPISDTIFGWDGGNIVGPTSSVDVGSINGSVPAAINLAIAANAYVVGEAAAGTLTSTQMTTTLTIPTANILSGRVLIFTSGANARLAALITNYQVASGRITFIAYNNQPAPVAPADGDSFLIL